MSLKIYQFMMYWLKTVNLKKRFDASFKNILELIDKLGLKFQPDEIDKISEEFSKYQLLNDEDIEQCVW